MKAGLPGVGIGGLFYVLLVAWMPFREVWLTLQGRSSARRWRRRVAGQVGLAAGILAALGAEWWSLARLPTLLAETWRSFGLGQPVPDPGQVIVGLEYVAPAIAAVPAGIIALLCVGLQLSRLAARGTRRTSGNLQVRRRAPTLAALAEQRRLRDTLRRRGGGDPAAELRLSA